MISRLSTPRALLALAALTVFFSTRAGATTINVPSDSTSIQAALSGASSGDTVLVAPETYTGPMNRNLDFSGKDIVLLAAQGPEVHRL